MDPKPPPLDGILETSLYVRDVERSVEFYHGVLGLPVLVREDRVTALDAGARGVLLIFQHGAASTPSESPRGTIPAHDGSGRLHLALAVAASDLDRWESYLTSRSIHVESRVEWSRGGSSIFFRDPDGHLLELAAPGVWETY